MVTDAYLIGINNLQAETLEYKNRVTAEGEAVALIVATDEGGARTAYLVKRSCHSGHPGIIAGPVALAAS